MSFGFPYLNSITVQQHFHNEQELIFLAEAQRKQRALSCFINALRSLRLCEGDFFVLVPVSLGWVFVIGYLFLRSSTFLVQCSIFHFPQEAAEPTNSPHPLEEQYGQRQQVDLF
jgi:hypothetical protein